MVNFSSSADNTFAKQLRQQISLQTCSGCHTGETKTLFTMIQPQGYGKPADYWSTTPSVISTATIDSRFTDNVGYTTNPVTFVNEDNYDLNACNKKIHIPVVSAFLTGRGVKGDASGPIDYNDDNDDATLDPQNTFTNDAKINGLYYVNDPSNKGASTVLHKQKKNGYNELERRKNFMCLLIDNVCIGTSHISPNDLAGMDVNTTITNGLLIKLGHIHTQID